MTEWESLEERGMRPGSRTLCRKHSDVIICAKSSPECLLFENSYPWLGFRSRLLISFAV